MPSFWTSFRFYHTDCGGRLDQQNFCADCKLFPEKQRIFELLFCASCGSRLEDGKSKCSDCGKEHLTT